MPQQQFNTPSAVCRLQLNHHNLMLVQFLPPSGKPQVCAALWRESDRVRLAAPLMRARNGVWDPKSYARQFPDALASIDAFEEAMTWLDAACYAAADPHEVDAACQQHPEWRLRCVYDGGDASLLGLAGLIRATETAGAFPETIMRDCLLEMIRQILKNDSDLAAGQIESTSQKGDDVATLDLGLDRVVIVTLLANIASTDVVRQGVLAHHRMTAPNNGRTHSCPRQKALSHPDAWGKKLSPNALPPHSREAQRESIMQHVQSDTQADPAHRVRAHRQAHPG